jgi:hypothetical protein
MFAGWAPVSGAPPPFSKFLDPPLDPVTGNVTNDTIVIRAVSCDVIGTSVIRPVTCDVTGTSVIRPVTCDVITRL